jgi:hypothetical protein
METISPADVCKDIAQIISADQEIILRKLPPKLNKEFRAEKWFNFFSGALAETTMAEREGMMVMVYSNPVGRAFDIAGGWKESQLAEYVAARRAEGYYKRYMQARRAGQFQTGKFTGEKRVPFLAKGVYKTGKFIKQILAEEAH